MKQIQKCPHCLRDTLFSHGVCPNCGHASKPEERLESDHSLYGQNGMPSYTEAMEEEMTVVQKHGAIQLGVSLAMLAFPPLSCFVAALFLKMDPHRTMEIPVFWTFVICGIVAWGSWKLWHGRPWLRTAFSMYGLIPGFIMLGLGIHEFLSPDSQPMFVFCGGLFGLMHLWSGWCLWKGRDLPEFLKYQQARLREE